LVETIVPRVVNC